LKETDIKTQREELKRAREVLHLLKDMHISVSKIEHSPVRSCIDARKYYDTAGYDIRNYGLCKNLFIRDKRGKHFWLIIIDYLKQIDMELLRNIFKSAKLGPATEDNLLNILGVPSGSVSIFSIINDYEQKVNVIIDSDLCNKEKLAFHPNYNCQTLFISFEDVIKFLDRTQKDYQIMNIPHLKDNQNINAPIKRLTGDI